MNSSTKMCKILFPIMKYWSIEKLFSYLEKLNIRKSLKICVTKTFSILIWLLKFHHFLFSCHQLLLYSQFSSPDQQSGHAAFISRGDSSCSWVVIHALGHNLGKEWGVSLYLLLGGDQSGREHTRLHSWTLYCTALRWYTCCSQQVGVGIYSHGYSAQLHSELKLKMKPCNTFTMIRFTITILL